MHHPEKYRDLEKIFEKIRKEYHFGKLSRKDLAATPWDQFAHWFMQAVRRENTKANVMMLATSAQNKVSARCVLLKGFDERGLLFYSNTRSRKAQQLKTNPQASVCFYWAEMERQVTVIGRVKKIPAQETKIYFRSRPRESQIAAWCSEQNRALESREELDRRFETISEKFKGREIPFPPYWSGFRLKPEEFEFWQGRANRLNDRFRYRIKNGKWRIERREP